MKKSVVILGAGAPNGLGGALARRFAREGHPIFLSGRSLDKLEQTAEQLQQAGGIVECIQVDVRSKEQQDVLFERVAHKGEIEAVLFNAGGNAVIPFADLTEEQFESFWRVGCYGGFLTAKRALPLLVKQGFGSLMFTGASASLRGRANFGHFSSSKSALRNLAQSLAKEYGPKGIHVAHIIIDGVIDGDRARSRFNDYVESLGEDGTLNPDAIAETFWAVHNQPRSAWTHELDIRPFKESW